LEAETFIIEEWGERKKKNQQREGRNKHKKNKTLLPFKPI
jgi:hypothetical protein